MHVPPRARRGRRHPSLVPVALGRARHEDLVDPVPVHIQNFEDEVAPAALLPRPGIVPMRRPHQGRPHRAAGRRLRGRPDDHHRSGHRRRAAAVVRRRRAGRRRLRRRHGLLGRRSWRAAGVHARRTPGRSRPRLSNLDAESLVEQSAGSASSARKAAAGPSGQGRTPQLLFAWLRGARRVGLTRRLAAGWRRRPPAPQRAPGFRVDRTR